MSNDKFNVPDGWKLVPVDLTDQMLGVMDHEPEFHLEYGEPVYVTNPQGVWSAMLAAAPQPAASTQDALVMDERAAFECWYKRTFEAWYLHIEDGDYLSTHTSGAWAAWKELTGPQPAASIVK